MKFDWTSILTLLKPLLMWALDKAWELAEEWAKNLFESSGQIPTGPDKMVFASNILKTIQPDIEDPEARALLEVQHIVKTKKSVMV